MLRLDLVVFLFGTAIFLVFHFSALPRRGGIKIHSEMKRLYSSYHFLFIKSFKFAKGLCTPCSCLALSRVSSLSISSGASALRG